MRFWLSLFHFGEISIKTQKFYEFIKYSHKIMNKKLYLIPTIIQMKKSESFDVGLYE